MRNIKIVGIINLLLIVILSVLIYAITNINYDKILIEQNRREISKITIKDNTVKKIDQNIKNENKKSNSINQENIIEFKEIQENNIVKPKIIFQSFNIEEPNIEELLNIIDSQDMIIISPYYSSALEIIKKNENIFINIPIKNDNIYDYATGPLYISSKQAKTQNIDNISKIISQHPYAKGFFIEYQMYDLQVEFLDNFFDLCKENNMQLIIKNNNIYDELSDYIGSRNIKYIIPNTYKIDEINYKNLFKYEENILTSNRQAIKKIKEIHANI